MSGDVSSTPRLSETVPSSLSLAIHVVALCCTYPGSLEDPRVGTGLGHGGAWGVTHILAADG